MLHQHHRVVARIALPLLAAGMITPAAFGHVFFDVDFDDVTISDPPGYADVPTEDATAGQTATQASYMLTHSSGSIRVYPSFVDSVTGATLGGSGNQVAIIDDPSTSNPFHLGFILAEADQPASGQVQMTFDLIADSFADDTGQPTNNEVFVVLLGRDGVGDNLANYKIRQQNGRVVATQYNDDGTTDSGTLGGNGTFPLGSVVSVRIIVDLDADTTSLYLNDQLIALSNLSDGTYSLNIKADQSFGGLVLTSPSGSTSRLGIDNVRIESVIPEPATLSPSLLGGVALVSRRRRKCRARAS